MGPEKNLVTNSIVLFGKIGMNITTQKTKPTGQAQKANVESHGIPQQRSYFRRIEGKIIKNLITEKENINQSWDQGKYRGGTLTGTRHSNNKLRGKGKLE